MDELNVPEADLEANSLPYTESSEQQERKIHWVGIIICSFFIVFFTLVFFCSFFIPRSEYLNSKEQHPELDFLDLPVSVCVFHWISYFLLLCLFIPLIIIFSGPRNSKVIFVLIVISIDAGLFSLVLIITYPICVRIFDIVPKVFDQYLDIATYERNLTAMTTEIPYFNLGATGEYHIKRAVDRYCYPDTRRINATSVNTSFSFPELGDYAWVEVTLNVSLTDEQQELFTNMSDRYRSLLPAEDQHGRDITWRYSLGFMVDSQLKGTFFVKRKALDGDLKESIGNTMMAFWSGAGYVYRLISIPVYHPVVTMKDIVINMSEIAYDDPMWTNLPETKCYTYSEMEEEEE